MKKSSQIMDREQDSDEKDPLIDVTELGHYIKRRREKEKLSLRAVAKQTQVSASTLARIENGTGIPDTPTLARLARWLNIPFERVVTGGSSKDSPIVYYPQESIPDIVAVRLRADRNLTPEHARALEDLLRVAYNQLSVVKGATLTVAESKTSEIECEGMLTPSFLLSTLGPFLQAIADIQYSIDEIQGKKRGKVLIKAITQQSPINISLEGAAKAVELVVNLLFPFWRKHQKKLAQLQEQERKVEIGNKKAEPYREAGKSS
jgi:transcriptional regulator with XRE-family HTH domain